MAVCVLKIKFYPKQEPARFAMAAVSSGGCCRINKMPWLYKQPGSPYWYIGERVRRNGKWSMRGHSTRKEKKDEAEKILARYRLMHEARKADLLNDAFYKNLTGRTVQSVFSIGKAFADWLDECKRSTSKKTLARYAAVASQFCKHVKADDDSPPVRDIRTADVSGFLNAQSDVLAASSVNLTRKALSTFFNHCVNTGLRTDNPVKATKLAAVSRKRYARRPYTLAELRAMLGRANAFWRYMIQGELYTGARMGDLICLRRDEVNIGANCVRLRMGKTGDSVEVPIAAPLRITIMARLHAVGPMKADAYLWPEQAARYMAQGSGPFSNEFYCDILVPCGLVPPRPKKHGKQKQGRGARRQLNDTTFHSLRHTFVSLLKTSGVSSAVAKELAGHSSDAVNDLYTHCSPEHLKQAIALLPEVL